MDVSIIFSNNFNEFQAFMQEIKSHRVVMTAIMEEIKYSREMEQTMQEVASKPERQFSNELKKVSDNLRGAGEFHRLPISTEVRYLPPHRREEGTMGNIAGERPNVARTTVTQMIFAYTNPIFSQLSIQSKF